MKARRLIWCLAALAFAGSARADIIVFSDVGESIFVTINGSPIANGGRVSNLTFTGELVSFDVTVAGTLNVVTLSGFTNLLEPPGADDPPGTVSDRFVESFVNGSPTYHVQIGSDPNLPTIPIGAIDLTTISAQGLPPNPYFEDGTLQKVGTAFFSNQSQDTYFIQSDTGLVAVPEPASLALLSMGALGLAGYGWRRKRAA